MSTSVLLEEQMTHCKFCGKEVSHHRYCLVSLGYVQGGRQERDWHQGYADYGDPQCWPETDVNFQQVDTDEVGEVNKPGHSEAYNNGVACHEQLLLCVD